MILAKQLRKYRKKAGYTQETLAEATNLSVDVIKRYESTNEDVHDRYGVILLNLDLIACKLGVPVWRLLCDPHTEQNAVYQSILDAQLALDHALKALHIKE